VPRAAAEGGWACSPLEYSFATPYMGESSEWGTSSAVPRDRAAAQYGGGGIGGEGGGIGGAVGGNGLMFADVGSSDVGLSMDSLDEALPSTSYGAAPAVCSMPHEASGGFAAPNNGFAGQVSILSSWRADSRDSVPDNRMRSGESSTSAMGMGSSLTLGELAGQLPSGFGSGDLLDSGAGFGAGGSTLSSSDVLLGMLRSRGEASTLAL